MTPCSRARAASWPRWSAGDTTLYPSLIPTLGHASWTSQARTTLTGIARRTPTRGDCPFFSIGHRKASLWVFRQSPLRERFMAASRQKVAAARSFDHQLDPAELFLMIEQRSCAAA